MDKKSRRFNDIIEKLKSDYPDVRCGLMFKSPFELLVATILSAQCTDKRVNEITKELFKKVSSPEEVLRLGKDGLIEYIKGAGLYENKSNNIIKTCQLLIEKFNGKVPKTRRELESLPGVGRKTASVVLQNAFEIPAFAVDTHVFRVANRLGFSTGKSPRQVEDDLTGLIHPDLWGIAHLLLIAHGRNVCKARKPYCNRCSVQGYCSYYQSTGNLAEDQGDRM